MLVLLCSQKGQGRKKEKSASHIVFFCLFVCNRGVHVVLACSEQGSSAKSPIAIRPIVSEVWSQGRNHRQIAQHYAFTLWTLSMEGSHRGIFHEATINMRLRSRLFTRGYAEVRRRLTVPWTYYRSTTARESQRTREIQTAWDLRPPLEGLPTHNSPANMLPRADAVPQFIQRWRCRY